MKWNNKKQMAERFIKTKDFRENLNHYFENKLDINDPKIESFILEMTGAMLILVPEATSRLIEQNAIKGKTGMYSMMAAIGSTMKKFGEMNLGGYENEETNLDLTSDNDSKLQH